MNERHHTVRLGEPVVDEHEVLFRWDVSPDTELYRRTSFRLSFPPPLDPRALPRALWWRVMLICLYPHFALLRPCRVELPVSLGLAEREFWLRLVDNVAIQLEAYGGAHRPGRAAELVDSGPPVEATCLPAAGNRTAVAFSGGKDSTVLAALAAELTNRPLLVMITSPVPWARDHVGVARDVARAEIVKRLPVELVEVSSDFRTAWELSFSQRDGCGLGVHEVSDLPLFQASLAAVAAMAGIRRCLMASEADAQYNISSGDRVLLHRDFMYSAVTQGALDALLRRWGIRQGSLTYPLHIPQVEGLLLRRYRKLADLQFSCWQAPDGMQACSACPKCSEIALVALAEGVSPRKVGIDPIRAIEYFADRRVDTRWSEPEPPIHEHRAPQHHVVQAVQATSSQRVAEILAKDAPANGAERVGEALAIYARLRAEALALTVPPAPGFITDFLDFVPPDLRQPLGSILAEHFPATSEPEFEAMAKRARALTAWIAEPLRARSGWGLRGRYR